MRVLIALALAACTHAHHRAPPPSWNGPVTPREVFVVPAPTHVEAQVTNEVTGRARSETAGEIHGVLIDANREPMPGVTVVASSPALVGEQVVISDESGRFEIDQLPPGTYEMAFYVDDVVFRHGGVAVETGKVVEQRVTGWRALP